MELVLGTVQLGLPYGITNSAGQVTGPAAAGLLERARTLGIRTLDTSHVYGEAVAVLGASLPTPRPFRFINKFKTLSTAEAEMRADAQTLGVAGFHAVLAHDPSDVLAQPEAYREMFRRLKGEGLAQMTGVSVYEPRELVRIMDEVGADLVQLPYNALNQSFDEGGLLANLARGGVEIHARSIFLQGLLLAPPARPNSILSAAHERFQRRALDLGTSPLALAAGCVANHPHITCAVVGATTARELEQVHAAFATAARADFSSLAETDPRVIDPRQWANT